MKVLEKAKTMMSQKNIESKTLKHVSAVYIFGSQATGKAGAHSDIDIGILLDERLPEKKYFDAKIELIQTLSDFFKRDDIDIVIMNNAPIVLAMNIISEGKVIFAKDKAFRVAFECHIMRQYYDREHYEKIALRYLIKRHT